MSHSKERKEKNCLNCGAEVAGRYCQVCGQENTEPKETFLVLVSHFFNDITHFDGKFFSTVKLLLTKPGFLSAEYLKGRRSSYLHPIRMYVFTSAFFFIIFFSLFNPESIFKENRSDEEQLTELTDASANLKEQLTITQSADSIAATRRSIDKIDRRIAFLKAALAVKKDKEEKELATLKLKQDSARKNGGTVSDAPVKKPAKIFSVGPLPKTNDSGVTRTDYFTATSTLRSAAAYDTFQNELPAAKRDGWFINTVTHKAILLMAKSKLNGAGGAQALFVEKWMHTLPQALFVSLPAFALLLLMLYSRRKFYYADHGIFAIHVYCASFIILLVYFGADKLQAVSGWKWLDLVKGILVLGVFFYLYKAMHNFYQQGRFKTILKFILLNLSFFAVVIIILSALTMLSIIRFS